MSQFCEAVTKRSLIRIKMPYIPLSLSSARTKRPQNSLVVQFVAESRFANCEFANLFFDLDELQFS